MIKVFISHSTQDRIFVEKHLLPIFKYMEIETWYSAQEIHPAHDWERNIFQALDSCDWFIVILSKNSQQSDWVRAEINWAIEHREGKIIPLLIEPCNLYNFHLRLPLIQHIDVQYDIEQGINQALEKITVLPINLAQDNSGPALAAAFELGCYLILILTISLQKYESKIEGIGSNEVVEDDLLWDTFGVTGKVTTQQWHEFIEYYNIKAGMKLTNEIAQDAIFFSQKIGPMKAQIDKLTKLLGLAEHIINKINFLYLKEFWEKQHIWIALRDEIQADLANLEMAIAFRCGFEIGSIFFVQAGDDRDGSKALERTVVKTLTDKICSLENLLKGWAPFTKFLQQVNEQHTLLTAGKASFERRKAVYDAAEEWFEDIRKIFKNTNRFPNLRIE